MPSPSRHEELRGTFGSDRFGVLAERLARSFGTPRYILAQTVVVIIWITINAIGIAAQWDPYPFILLNLAFSTQAAYAAPLILLAQSRQAARDKVRADVEHARAEKAEAHREEIADRQLALLMETHAVTLAVRILAEQTREDHGQLLKRQGLLLSELTGRH